MDFGALQHLEIRINGKNQQRKWKRNSPCGSRSVEWYPGKLESQMLQEGLISWVKYHEQITLVKLN